MGRIATVHSPAQERGIVQGIKRSIGFRRAFSLLLAVVLGIMSVGLGGEVAIAKPRRSATPPAPISTRKLTEVSPPEAIQTLRQQLEVYQPQVKILSPRPEEVLSDDQVSVRFQVKDLPLFKDKALGLGPHLHVFLDNQPYRPVYSTDEPLVFKDLTPGTHILRVFAARPWHESFKNEGAYAQVVFHVLTKTGENRPDPNQPLLTYSRPQGSYGAEPIMLDFYLVNAPLHLLARERRDDDLKDWQIRATINGESFTFDEWQPIYLKGFKPGRNWVQLELIDDKGAPIPNVFNNTARFITLEPNGTDALARLVRGELTDAMAIVDPTYRARVEAERREAERIEAERREAERREAERLEAERREAERLEAERREAERLEAERLEAERQEAIRREQEAIRQEAERREAERIEAERLEAERQEAERIEAERRAAERQEAERQQAERRALEEARQQALERRQIEEQTPVAPGAPMPATGGLPPQDVPTEEVAPAEVPAQTPAPIAPEQPAAVKPRPAKPKSYLERLRDRRRERRPPPQPAAAPEPQTLTGGAPALQVEPQPPTPVLPEQPITPAVPSPTPPKAAAEQVEEMVNRLQDHTKEFMEDLIPGEALPESGQTGRGDDGERLQSLQPSPPADMTPPRRPPARSPELADVKAWFKRLRYRGKEPTGAVQERTVPGVDQRPLPDLNAPEPSPGAIAPLPVESGAESIDVNSK